ncbi:hypothetical protein GGS26DRAFT_603780 [Hypomontagnella submonticulosa]|nr:hypothetical protein GGS26DRAFT_603780 [Hypomontagnella submonticulosa]
MPRPVDDLVAPATSDTKKRYTTGFPVQPLPGMAHYAGSSPGCSSHGAAKHNDYYRNRAAPYVDKDGVVDATKMSRDAPFRTEYENYKQLDDVVSDEVKNVKAYMATAQPGKAKALMRAGNASVRYGGRPLESEPWHRGAADAKRRAADAWREVADAREKFRQDFIGHDTPQNAKGHNTRIKISNSRAKEFSDAAQGHLNPFRGQ